MGNISKKLRALVARRALFCCEYCSSQEKYAPDYFSVEHIFPRAKGGDDDPENLAYACMACNIHKYTHTEALDPITGVFVPLYNPRKNTWPGHFQWSSDFSMMIGITPTGRASIEKLLLNRPSLINLRLVLAGVGKHPPQ